MYARLAFDVGRSFRGRCYDRVTCLGYALDAVSEAFEPESAEVWRRGVGEPSGELLHSRRVEASERPSTVARRLTDVLRRLDPGRVTSSIAVVRGKWGGLGCDGVLAANNSGPLGATYGDVYLDWGAQSDGFVKLFLGEDAKLFLELLYSLGSRRAAEQFPRPLTLILSSEPPRQNNADKWFGSAGLSYKATLTHMFNTFVAGVGIGVRTQRIRPYRPGFLIKNLIRAIPEDTFYRILGESGVTYSSAHQLLYTTRADGFAQPVKRLSQVFTSFVEALPSATAIRTLGAEGVQNQFTHDGSIMQASASGKAGQAP